MTEHGYIVGARCTEDTCPTCGAPNQWSVVQAGGYVVFQCGTAYDGKRVRRKGDACDLIAYQRRRLDEAVKRADALAEALRELKVAHQVIDVDRLERALATTRSLLAGTQGEAAGCLSL